MDNKMDNKKEDWYVKNFVQFQLDAFKNGDIEGADLALAISEIMFGKVDAPGVEEEKKDVYDRSVDILKDEIAGDMATALISYVESHLMETVGWQLDGTEFDNDDDFVEMQEAVVCKLIGMLNGND